jgi:hypothetical protein
VRDADGKVIRNDRRAAYSDPPDGVTVRIAAVAW